MKIRVGTRGSELALTQTKWVIACLKEKHPLDEFEIVVIKTKGDRIQNVALSQIGGTGVFVKEIERALMEDKIDMAIHSLKDMPSTIPEDLILAKVPKREDPRDVLITKMKIDSIDELPENAIIGTGSKRRVYQIGQLKPKVQCVPIRGNVHTRIAKIEEGLDGVVLAMAGINRLGLSDSMDYCLLPLTIEEMLPSPCQGILGIEVKRNQIDLLNKIEALSDDEAIVQSLAERSFLKSAEGNCHIPIGAYCHVQGDEVILEGLLGKEDCSSVIRHSIKGNINVAETLGVKLGKAMAKEVGLW